MKQAEVAHGFQIAFIGGLVEPVMGLVEIQFDAFTVEIHVAEEMLYVRISGFCQRDEALEGRFGRIFTGSI